MATHEPQPTSDSGLAPGERVDRPWQYGDPFDPDGIRPSTRSDRAGIRSAFSGLTTPEQLLALLSSLPRAPGEPAQTDQRPRPDAVIEYELRRDHLLTLQQCRGTEDTERALASVEQALDGYVEQGMAPPQALLEQREREVGRLRVCHERDALARGRPDGCWCLGAGGRGLLAIIPTVDGRTAMPTLPDDEQPPLRFGCYCVCPEAEAERERARAEHERLKRLLLEQRVSRLLDAARIPPGYEHLTLETFPNQKLAAQMGRWYARNIQRLADRAHGITWAPAETSALKPGVLLWGNNRTGKTGLAIGCVKLALEERRSTIFRTVPDLLDELRATYDPENEWCHAELLALLKNVPLLVLDDLGAQRVTGWVSETMYVLLNHRMNEQLLTIFTTNLDPSSLLEHCGERIFWRVREPSHEVPLTELLGEAKRLAAASLDPFAERYPMTTTEDP
jgi:DNA replication protein DnaC